MKRRSTSRHVGPCGDSCNDPDQPFPTERVSVDSANKRSLPLAARLLWSACCCPRSCKIVLQAELSAGRLPTPSSRLRSRCWTARSSRSRRWNRTSRRCWRAKRAVEDLQLNPQPAGAPAERLGPATAEGAYLESLRRDGDVVNIRAWLKASQVSDLLRNLSSRSQWLDRRTWWKALRCPWRCRHQNKSACSGLRSRST